ncbi:SpoIIE family protein phosphatase [Streptomyces sp. NPDC012825]|uniref:SpoIIE family protein phosphatase n=1 Tax=Streptomyces sp. NPDC012825 TaxID=3364851 RepID=UPI00369BBF9D
MSIPGPGFGLQPRLQRNEVPFEADAVFEALEQIPDAVTVCTALRDTSGRAIDMRLEYMNVAARSAHPEPDTAIGGLCSEVWPLMVKNGTFAACMRVLDSGVGEQGPLAWTEESTYRAADYEYQAVRIGTDRLLWVLRDNSARVRRAEVLAAIVTSLAGATSFEEVLGTLTAQIMPAVGATTGAAVLNEPDSNTYTVQHIHDAQEGLRPPAPFSISAPYPMAHTARTGKALFFSTSAERDRVFPEAAPLFQERHRSSAVLPLAADGSLLGAVSFHFAVQHPFDPSERAFLTALADHCALALERVRLRASADAAQAQLQVLADLGRALPSSLDTRANFRSLAEAVVPRIADACVIHLLDREGRPKLAMLRHRDPRQQRELSALLESFPPQRDAEGGVGAVVRTGRHELITNVSGALDRLSRSAEHRTALHRLLPAASWLAVPMTHDDRVIGAMVLIQSATGRKTFTERDIPFAEDLAQRAAQAVVNSRRYTAQQDVADILQRSLLPANLPRVPGVDLAVCYHAGAEGTLVGGDFYDIAPLGSRAWSFAIGDVCGKGPQAAALTGLVRHTARAAARVSHDPEYVLRAVNAAILAEQGASRFCTAAYGVIDFSNEPARLSLALGGHPPPFLRRADGEIIALGRPGALLGIFDTPPLQTTMHEIRSGDLLVLYTDGVTERRSGTSMFAESGIRRVMENLTDESSAEVLGILEEAVINYTDSPLDDDFAIMVLRIT